MSPFVRNVLDLPSRIAEQLVCKVGQGTRCSDLLPDLHDLLVIRVTARVTMADLGHVGRGQPCLGSRLPILLMKGDLDWPASYGGHV